MLPFLPFPVARLHWNHLAFRNRSIRVCSRYPEATVAEHPFFPRRKAHDFVKPSSSFLDSQVKKGSDEQKTAWGCRERWITGAVKKDLCPVEWWALEVADGMLSPDPGQNHPAGGCPDSKGFKVNGVLTWNTWSRESRQEGLEFYEVWLQHSFSLDPGSPVSLAGLPGGGAGIVWSDACYWILCVCYISPTPRDLTPIGEAGVVCFRSKIWLMPEP